VGLLPNPHNLRPRAQPAAHCPDACGTPDSKAQLLDTRRSCRVSDLEVEWVEAADLGKVELTVGGQGQLSMGPLALWRAVEGRLRPDTSRGSRQAPAP
jgi:hypothetical protein